MFFSEVLGNSNTKEKLIQSVKDGRISHAQLYTGEAGSPNLALALAYSQFVVCENKQENDSCGTCSSCVKSEKLIHPDIHFVFPVNTNTRIKKDASSDKFIAEWRSAVEKNPYMDLFWWMSFLEVDNKQGIINVEESAEILKKLNLKSFESEYKVMIIWLPEKMNISAANKLLKILEEPPEKTLFLLVTQQYDQLLATITSRTQLVKVLKPSDEELAQKLVDKYSVDFEQAMSFAHLSDGNYTEAVSILEANDGEVANVEKFQFWMRICYSNKVDDILQWVDGVSKIGREHQKNFLSYAMHMIRESLLSNLGIKSLVRLRGTELDFCSKFSKFIHKQNSFEITEQLEKAAADIEHNANPKIVFLDLSFKMIELLRKPNN